MIRDRLEALRQSLPDLGVDGVCIPKSDMFMGEYVRACDERLAWISGFTGSAGFAVITQKRAAIFVDSRYRLQAKIQCPDFEVIHWPEQNVRDVFGDEVIGYDPKLLTQEAFEKLTNFKLISNPIDAIWQDRPQPKRAKLRELPLALAGATPQDKIDQLTQGLRALELDAFVSNSPEGAAWLLNLRGGEIPTVPAPHVVTVIHTSGALEFYSDGTFDGLEVLPLAQMQLPEKTGADPQYISAEIYASIKNPHPMKDPIIAAKACKNGAEIKASQNAHLRDAVAWVKFWQWLEAQDPLALDELQVIDMIWKFREAEGAKVSSFETIAGFNANGAIVHYRADRKSNLPLGNGILLLDSGAHYEGATTDITRTLAIGKGLDVAKTAFTLVLNGLAEISSARFPKGKAGRDIDAFARASLWQEGLDYGHGTGHGVGAELSVHEGPQGISSRNSVALDAGMIVSLEPGFYKEGEYGIRLENLAYLIENNGFMSFEPLTFVPFDTSLIDPSHLNSKTQIWLNAYHQACFKRLSPLLSAKEIAFLETKCRNI